MRRILISLALGLFLVPLILGWLFILKLFTPTAYPSTFMWLFIWSDRVLVHVPLLKVTTASVLTVSLLGDYLIFSFLIYLGLALRGRFRQRHRRAASPPSIPAPFSD
jgi:hypothetical protein